MAIEDFVLMAKDAGIPKDQLENFVKYKYVPFPWQMKFHAEARKMDRSEVVDLGIGGARGPGKSHCIFAQVALDDCQRVSQLKCLFLRQTGKSARESFEDLIGNILRGKIKYDYNISTGTVKFPNGSRLLMGGFENDNDIDKYVGIEYDLIVIEELTQLTCEKVSKLKGSLRSIKWKARFYTSFNPGGKGHAFVKNYFVEPFRQNKETTTKFIPATYQDNPLIQQEYINYLNDLTGNLGKAWREGNWDIMEGQYFTEWDPLIHTCRPYDLGEVSRFISIDYGYSEPCAVYWLAVDNNKRIIAYREYYDRYKTYEDIAAVIKAMTPINEKIDYLVLDPSCFAKMTGSNKSGSEIFSQRGFYPIRGNNDRLNGWRYFREFLKPIDAGYSQKTAKLQIFTTCPNLIRTMPEMIHDENKPEDCDTTGEDHGIDSIRYGLMSRYNLPLILTEDQITDQNIEAIKLMRQEQELRRRQLWALSQAERLAKIKENV